MKRLVAILPLLVLCACASEAPPQASPPLDAWKSKIPYKPKEVRVEGPTVVALMPPILFGRFGYEPNEAEILASYQKSTGLLESRMPPPAPPVLLTSADVIVIPAASGMAPLRLERNALEGHYGYVLAEPGREPKVFAGLVPGEKLLREAEKYFKLKAR